MAMGKQAKSAVAEADRWMDALNGLRRLEPGWDGSDAEAPNERSLHWAERTLTLLNQLGFEPARVGASVEGGVTISFIEGDRYGDVECFNSGEILAVTSDRSGQPDVWVVPPDDSEIILTLERIRGFIQSTASGAHASEWTSA